MKYNLDDIVAIIIGIMSAIVVLYRVGYFMIPMMVDGYRTKNIPKMFKGLTMLV